MTQVELRTAVEYHIGDIVKQYDLEHNPQIKAYIKAASNDLIPLVMAVAQHPQIELIESLTGANFLFIRENAEYEDWESSIKSHDLQVVGIPSEVIFPWQPDPSYVPFTQKMLEETAFDLLTYLPDDEHREGLRETPKRVAKAWMKWCEGYNQDPAAILKVFEDGAEGADEMVVVRNIPIYSKCEHHLADIFGTADIAYIPKGKVVGLSKLSRVANIFARRLQVQERLTNQIADAIWENLEPVGVGVVIRARHMCMESRGLCQQGHFTVTSALRGAFKEDPRTRQEFLTLTNSDKGV